MRISAEIFKRQFNFSTGKATGRRNAVSGRGFDVTQPSRLRRTVAVMRGIMASADYHLDKLTLGKLRELCRDLDRQTPLISGMLDRAQDNVVGTNFDFIPNVKTGDKNLDKDLNKKVKDFITSRMEARYCDASGINDFEEMLKLTLRAAWNDGDNLWVKKSNGSALVFEADQIISPSGNNSKDVVLGVQLGENNRHVAYYVKQRARTGDYGYGKTPTNSEKVVAANAFMPAFRKRFNQTRGVPFLAAMLGFHTRANNYIDFEMIAAEANSMQGVKITRDKELSSSDNWPGMTNNEDTSTNSTFEKVEKMEPLMIYDLLPGEDIGMFGAQRPGQNFDPFVIMCCRIIGVCVGYPLELMLLDFSKTNYSSARASLKIAEKAFRNWQKWCFKKVCLPWYRWQISRGIATGRLPARSELYNVRCQWPAWDHIDPKKAAEANTIFISTAQKSISECIRETGGEPDEVFDEIKEDNEKLAERGITLPKPTVTIVAGGGDKDEESEKENE